MADATIDASEQFGAEPIATALMSTGIFDKKAFKAAYGKGGSAPNEEFGFRFAYSLAVQAAAVVKAAGGKPADSATTAIIEPAMERFAVGALKMQADDDLFSFAVDCMKSSIADALPKWSQLGPHGAKMLTTEAKMTLARIFSMSKEFKSEQRTVLIEALSDADKYRPSQSNATSKHFVMLARAKAEHLKAEIDAHASPAHPSAKASRI